MSFYTTGELAKLCDVSVRTVQYYDARKILVPSKLSEGGRRLYTDDDLRQLKIICFLRGVGLSIDNIARILAESNCHAVISLMLEEQAGLLKHDIHEQKTKLHKIEALMQEIRGMPNFSFHSIGDIAFTMDGKKNLRKIHLIMLTIGVLMDLIVIAALILWIAKGSWLAFAVGLPIVILCGVFLTGLYYRKTAYICPACHRIFKPGLREFLFSSHTPKARKLTCNKCGCKSFCLETYSNSEE